MKKVPDEKLIKKWLDLIEADMIAAEDLYQAANARNATSWYSWLLVIWHCHQAVEKCLKAIIISQNKETLRIHDLVRLLDETQLTNLPPQWKEKLYQLNNFYFSPRYPDVPLKISYPQSNQQLSQDFLKFAKEFHLWTTEQINQKK